MTMSKLVESLVNTVIRTMALTNTEVAAVTEQLNHDLLMTAKMFPIWLQKQIQKEFRSNPNSFPIRSMKQMRADPRGLTRLGNRTPNPVSGPHALGSVDRLWPECE